MTSSKIGTDTTTGKMVELFKLSRLLGLYIVGLQGMGKSGLFETLIDQDIRQGVGMCVLDPHGELIDHIIARLPDRKEEDKVIYLNLAENDYFYGLNLFSCADPTSDAEIMKTVNQVTHVFEKAFEISRTTPRMYDYLFNTAYTLTANPGCTMIDICVLLTNAACRQKLLANVVDTDVLDFWDYYNQLSPKDQREESREILRRLNDLIHAPLRFIVGQSTSTINLQKIMDEGKILLVKLDRQREQATSLIDSIIGRHIDCCVTMYNEKTLNPFRT